MPEDAYRTIADRTRVRVGVQDSEFLGHVAPVESVAAAESFVEHVEDDYDDATHNVPAYRVRADPFREYSSDDGEPSGSAGKPILSVLQGRDLENVAVVVTRYYGGTDLGVGGLVRAYSTAAREALDATDVVEKRPIEQFTAVVEYDDSGTVRGVLESEDVPFEADYGERVVFAVHAPRTQADALRDRLLSATSGRVEIE